MRRHAPNVDAIRWTLSPFAAPDPPIAAPPRYRRCTHRAARSRHLRPDRGTHAEDASRTAQLDRNAPDTMCMRNNNHHPAHDIPLTFRCRPLRGTDADACVGAQ